MKYEGTGMLTIPDMSVLSGSFELEFEESGKSKLLFKPEDQKEALKFNNLPINSGKFAGECTNPKAQLDIERVYLTTFHLDMKVGEPLDIVMTLSVFSPIKLVYKSISLKEQVEVRRGLTNLLFWGTEIVQQGDARVFGKTTWHLAGRDVILEQTSNYKAVTSHLAEFKDVAVTCELKLGGNYDEVPLLKEITENLQNLFSLASANYVTPLYEEIYSNGTLSEVTLLPLKTYTFSNRPSLIDSSFPGNEEFKNFIEVGYPNYVNLRDNMGLPYFTEFFTTAKMYSPLEVEYLLATTAFECLESYYRTWRSLPEASGGLKGKIDRLCKAFGFTVTPTELESYRVCRNNITHEGKFPASVDKLITTMELRNLMDRFLLTMLGYKNKPYWNVVKNAKDSVA